MRRQVSLRIHDYAALYISEDVAVPLSAIARLVDALPEYERRYGLEIFAFGHAGDGNIHLNITTQDAARRPRVMEGVRALLQLVLSLGGNHLRGARHRPCQARVPRHGALPDLDQPAEGDQGAV